MPEFEAFYDHEQDQPQRHVPDWGGDEVFATVPRRRFSRSERMARRAALPDLSGLRRPSHAPQRSLADALAEADPQVAPAPVAAAEPADTAPPATPEPPAQTGRRTVVVTGRPEPLPAARRRPARTLDERVSGRPERVAGWACGLGLLLILVAVSTADAAPL